MSPFSLIFPSRHIERLFCARSTTLYKAKSLPYFWRHLRAHLSPSYILNRTRGSMSPFSLIFPSRHIERLFCAISLILYCSLNKHYRMLMMSVDDFWKTLATLCWFIHSICSLINTIECWWMDEKKLGYSFFWLVFGFYYNFLLSKKHLADFRKTLYNLYNILQTFGQHYTTCIIYCRLSDNSLAHFERTLYKFH
jgi:hypothetical protein